MCLIRAQPWGRGGEHTGTWGGLLGGNASVARNRQNKELFSNIILQMDQSNTTDKFISHSVWQTITLFQCVQHYSTFVFWVFWFSLLFQACERCSTLSGQKWEKNSSRLFYLNFFFYFSKSEINRIQLYFQLEKIFQTIWCQPCSGFMQPTKKKKKFKWSNCWHYKQV